MGGGSGPPSGACIIHHGAGELTYIAGLRSWRIDHFSYSGGDPAYPSFEQSSSWSDQCEATRWVVYLVLPQITSYVDPFDWFPEECYWSGLDKAPSGTLKDDRGALGDINGDSPFTQPPLKVVEVWLQVTDEQRRLAGRRYDGRVVIGIELTRRGARGRACRWHTDWRGQERPIHPELLQPACHDEMTRPSVRTLRTSDPGGTMKLYGLCKMGSLGASACRKAIDPDGMEGFGHVEENCAC